MATPRKKRKYEIRYDWLKFAQSYLGIALLACDEMIKNKYKQPFPNPKEEVVKKYGLKPKLIDKYKIHILFLPALYNTKHEVFIKTLKKILGNEILKDRDAHNTIKLFEKLKILVNEGHIKNVITEAKNTNPSDSNLPIAEEDLKNIKKYIGNLEELVLKYQRCDLMKGKIENDFEIEDGDNTAFRYPENSLKIQLNYEKILLKITKNDVRKIRKDIEALWENFNNLGFILEIYSQYK